MAPPIAGMPGPSETQPQPITQRMKYNDTRSRDHRQGRGGRRRPKYGDQREQRAATPITPKKTSFWHKFIGFFTGNGKRKQSSPGRTEQPRTQTERRRMGPPERVAVTTPKLYVGNLNYDTIESDLLDLFKGVGQVQNVEIVTHRDTEKSKGFGFVTMLTVDEAIRAVETLHDKAFMGRKLLVNGSRSGGARNARE